MVSSIFRHRTIFVLAAMFCSIISSARPSARTSVAVVTDSLTYSHASAAIEEYLSSMQLDGKRGILLIDRWGVPDSLRAALKNLYENESLEGAVLVGDIPVPMIRDAQHLSSAFKMNQQRDWKSSSVPSDRFYDDFSLEFRFLKRDADKPELFYYSLSEDSPQRLRSAIYTSRIKPADKDHKYELIDAFLKKAVKAKKDAAVINHVLFFAGHGYNSESMVARMAEYKALHEQFPTIESNGGKVDFINHDFDESVKNRLLAGLSEPSVDLAILHHHGYNNMQLLNGSPYVSSPEGWLSLAQNYFRVKMRSSRNPEKLKADYIKRYGIPVQWLEEASDPKFIAQDSLYSRSLDIYPEDVDAHSIAAKFIIFDACFNGAFIEDDYIVSHYLFSDKNSTLAALAHSVNSLQDVWCDEMVGLFSEGVCAGNIYKNIWNLETHIFGDPTFHYSSLSSWDAAAGRGEYSDRFWRKAIASKEVHPDVKALAIRKLVRRGSITPEELINIQSNSSSGIVRLAAFDGNAEIAPDCFDKAILLALNDDYELLQRLGAKFASYNQSPALAEKAVQLFLDPLTSKRVLFHIKSLFVTIDGEKAKSLVLSTPYWKGEEGKESLCKYIDSNSSSKKADIDNLSSESIDLRSAKLFIRAQRNQCRTDALDPIAEYYTRCSDPDTKLLIAETLGWYRYSYLAPHAQSLCQSLLEKESDPRLRAELTKSIHRINE